MSRKFDAGAEVTHSRVGLGMIHESIGSKSWNEMKEAY
jgi:hypothetical protein